MEGGKTFVEDLLNMCDDAASAASSQFVRELIEMHERMRIKRRADPPSDARFAEMVGLKASTYAKAKRSLLDGRSPSFSRKSLAAIVLCDALPDDVRAGAFRLLWLAVFSGAKPARLESLLVRQALCLERYLPNLAKAVVSPSVASARRTGESVEASVEDAHASGS